MATPLVSKNVKLSGNVAAARELIFVREKLLSVNFKFWAYQSLIDCCQPPGIAFLKDFAAYQIIIIVNFLH